MGGGSGPFWRVLLMLVFSGISLPAWGGETNPGKIERLVVGAGGVSGIYFPAAGAICRDANQYFNKAGGRVHCAVEPTEGSVENLQLLRDGDVQLGIVQSDVISDAWNGRPPFDAKLDRLRSVVSLYSESLTVVVRGDAGIKEWEDLQGKKVSIGPKGSGSRRTAMGLMRVCGITPQVLEEDRELSPDGATRALRDKEIDAYFFVVGHPNENIWNMLATANARVLTLPEACRERFVREYPYFVKTTIPAGLYPNLAVEVPSVAVKATLMTTIELDEETVYQFARTIVEKLYRFSRLDPDFLIPDPRSLFEGLVVPLHLGAFKYFQEMRIIEVKAGRADPGKDVFMVPESVPVSHWKMGYNAPLQLAKLGVGYVRDDDPINGLALHLPLAAATTIGGAVHWMVTGEENLGRNAK
ncbi:MAG: TAXI family TRAP transporter solute-binding subunit [Magnetococcales bacterium]|nr:TAXI family TRAP transporter solute-binding subunit [Magnetococcales bacterium]MBF0149986.1 TAXI family TRAP transporter solute-binding subunit [Magnetococcales bacterium]MBF0173616.1 TAXI family TRAP transporter solute-binding subunit [Magnetococcales bacterium]MBF0631287.1 TAXI family TRAP transporter solute-binding subunit [Magnetococcales bacterium]